MPTPFFDEVFTFTQPDGTKLELRGWGDQNHALFETLDGFTVIKDPVTSFYQYATLNENGDRFVATGFQAEMVNPYKLGLAPKLRIREEKSTATVGLNFLSKTPRWKIRREIARMQVRSSIFAEKEIMPAPPKRNTVGDFIGLCLVVDFPDIHSPISQSDIDGYCNLSGYRGFGNNGSVYDYFFDNSDGKLRYKLIVAPTYIAKHDRDYYTDPKQPYGLRAQELIRENLDFLREKGFDFTNLTIDDEKYVYATNLFYAGGIVNNWAEGLWPHSGRMETDYQLANDKIVADYQITNIGDELVLGVFCHENGHMICDFPDLYDYGKDGTRSYGVGGFCLMCFGAKLDLKNPTKISAYLKYRAGWATNVTSITDETDVTLCSTNNDFFVYQNNSAEYFIVENRYKDRRDLALPGSGLAIWHIDETGNNENQDRLPGSHYECSLVQADGKFDLEKAIGSRLGDGNDLFYAPQNTHFGTQTIPKSQWWDGSLSRLDIYSISEIGSCMSFKAKLV